MCPLQCRLPQALRAQLLLPQQPAHQLLLQQPALGGGLLLARAGLALLPLPLPLPSAPVTLQQCCSWTGSLAAA